MGRFLSISLKLNFTPHTLGCYGLIYPEGVHGECITLPQRCQRCMQKQGSKQRVPLADYAVK